MKVTQVLFSGLGGHGSVVTSLVLADSRSSWGHGLIFYGTENLLPAYEQFCIAQKVPFNFIQKRRGVAIKAIWSLLRAINRQRPDIILLHNPGLSFPVWLWCLISRKKFYVVEHTPLSVKGKVEWTNTLIALLLAEKVVCLSSSYQQALQLQFKRINCNKRTVVIRNGIDLSAFGQGREKISNEYHIGMAGRFTPQKNQMLLLKAALMGFKEKKIGEEVHFHFAGNGESLPELKEFVSSNGLNGKIHFHGLLTEKELILFLQKLDLYVHASYSETMCTSVMQAMACGLPVAGSDIPGINDLLDDKTVLSLFPNGDEHELLRIIMKFSDPNLRAVIGTKSFIAANERFSGRRTFEEYNKLFHSI